MAGTDALVTRPKEPARLGKEKDVETNYFLVQRSFQKTLQKILITAYTVVITPKVPPNSSGPNADTSKAPPKGLKRAVMEELVRTHAAGWGNRLPAYDGDATLYTVGSNFGFEEKHVEVTLPENESAAAVHLYIGKNLPIRAPGRSRTFSVTISNPLPVVENPASWANWIAPSAQRQPQSDCPQPVIQALNIAFQEVARMSGMTIRIGNSSFWDRQCKALTSGFVGWHGFFQSIRPTQLGLSLNVNTTATAFYKSVAVLTFIQEHFPAAGIPKPPSKWTAAQEAQVSKALKGVTVETHHRHGRHRVLGLSKPPKDLNFMVKDPKSKATKGARTGASSSGGSSTSSDSQKETDVAAYFKEASDYAIEYVNLPCLEVGNRQKPKQLPMELCFIAPGQRYPFKLLPAETCRDRLREMTSEKPMPRKSQIVAFANQLNRAQAAAPAAGEGAYLSDFGLKLDNTLLQVKARVLQAPNMKPGTPQRLLTDGGRNLRWACVKLSSNGHGLREINFFCRELVSVCRQFGVTIQSDPLLPEPVLIQPRQTELKRQLMDVLANVARTSRSRLDLLFVIIEGNPKMKAEEYGELKALFETDQQVGLLTQFCLGKYVRGFRKENTDRKTADYMKNVAMKINCKTGGTNRGLNCTSYFPWSDKTMIFGADVNHPGTRSDDENARSLAAVVASNLKDWPQVTTYKGRINAQRGGQEMIENLKGIVVELLGPSRPNRILFYRDGVGEGQFQEVLTSEVESIRQACREIDEKYLPRLTFVLVQKRHNTRFFPIESPAAGSCSSTSSSRSSWVGDRGGPGRGRGQNSNQSDNIDPGTVVDSQICHHQHFDFYLCSHVGRLGTSRPAHYHVLVDDNKFTADQIQKLTYDLCHTYARCKDSVSIVPPAYYAHHLAKRARCYMNGTVLRQPVAAIKDNMFYC